MRKQFWAIFIAMVMVTAMGTAAAADIKNLSGQSCGADAGMWHFVNNQVPKGSGVGRLTAMWDSGDMCTVGPSQVNKKVQHFNCNASGALISASTDLGGNLVLSDFSCEDIKEPPPPPPCDPETDPDKCEPPPPPPPPPCDPKDDPKCEVSTFR